MVELVQQKCIIDLFSKGELIIAQKSIKLSRIIIAEKYTRFIFLRDGKKVNIVALVV